MILIEGYLRHVFFPRCEPHLAPNAPEELSVVLERGGFRILELQSYLHTQGIRKYN